MSKKFSENTIIYLNNLNQNNNKVWFEDHRTDYENYLLNPFKELVEELKPYMLEIDSLLDFRFNKCISRIYRDVRFSKDKSPYRSNMWVSFKRESKDWKLEPCYYFELFPNGYRFGMGYYNMPKEILEKIRKLIEEEDEEFIKIYSLIENQHTFSLEGESYKRNLSNNIDEKYRAWYQKKEIYFVCNKGLNDTILGGDLSKELVESFKLLQPAYEFLLSLREL
jgi:uncharacterized protein (TIGR02453 family)